MNDSLPIAEPPPSLSWKATTLAAGCAVACFHLAYAHSLLAPLMLGYLGGLVALTRAAGNRRAFYTGLGVGLAVFVPQMSFLWTIFGLIAVPLWLVLAFWIGLFVLLGRQCWQRFGEWTWLLLPVLWTGLEYFRSELYPLRFSWLNVGFAFWEWPTTTDLWGGSYGVGFWLMALVTWSIGWKGSAWKHWRLAVRLVFYPSVVWFFVALLGPALRGHSHSRISYTWLHTAGIQMEFTVASEVPAALDKLLHAYPEAELLVLSEYTFGGPVPDAVKDWCRQNNRWLIAGGKDELGNGQFYNTAFVVSTNGEVVFKQVKAVPIPFFKDGLPAPEQKLWDSPWGKIGICICYDLNFTRVTDELVRQGAEFIINPTMDVIEWGERQHRLHARVPRVRAVEYGVPIFRVASSGISQFVGPGGYVMASASFPGQGAMVDGKRTVLRRRIPHVPRPDALPIPRPDSPIIARPGSLPYDRFLAPACTFVTGAVVLYLSLTAVRARLCRPVAPPSTTPTNS